MEVDWPDRWQHVHHYLKRAAPFAVEGFQPGAEVIEYLHECSICIIGAGGLGCELIKNLAMTGFKDIHIIDMDTIDVSNLNRQFLFRQKDVGRSKAEVAAEFVMNRVPGCKVTPYFGKIQDKDEEFYSQFTLIICGLDSVEARRWMNAMVIGMYDEEDPSTLKPLIDGGTEGFKGQSRVILPRMTACYECSLEMQTKPKTFPMCTIANTPRLPEHCIQFASEVQWPEEFKGKKLDGDNPEHIQWCLRKAKERADQYGIRGITYSLTQGVVKNIIPAIASTNAIIAASCANEAYKLVTGCAGSMQNYMMYVGDAGIYTYTFALEQKEECPVCGSAYLQIEMDKNKSLQDLMELLLEKNEVQLKRPSLRTSTKSLYMQAPPQLEEMTRKNLAMKLHELFNSDEEINVTDMNLPISLRLHVKFK
ncbi:hypothetical protein HDV06_001188 [Boothiomyces sp. JEL0866]|nr:hypothetical protein HDV06_001188 [Boothiomyces sp. JEL0866]